MAKKKNKKLPVYAIVLDEKVGVEKVSIVTESPYGDKYNFIKLIK